MKFTKFVKDIKLLNSRIGGNWQPKFQLLRIYEEMGEPSRELFKYNQLPAKLHDDSKKQVRINIKEELGDILYGLMSLSQNIGS